MAKVLIVDNKAHEIWEGSAPPLHSGLQVVDYGGVVNEGDIWDGSVFSAPVIVTLDATQATTNQLLDEFDDRGLEDSLFAAMTPKEQRRFLGAGVVRKEHPLVQAFLTSQGYDADAITDVFNSAAAR